MSPAETGFYYLQSRYYDPMNCRFINADSQINLGGFIDYNMFGYCSNNPVACSDYDGRDQEYVICGTERKFRVGNIKFVITITYYLTVPDGMPCTITFSKSEFSVGGSFSDLDISLVAGYFDDDVGYAISLTLYNGETCTGTLNSDGSISIRYNVDSYSSIEFNIQASMEDNGNGTLAPWVLAPQNEKSKWEEFWENPFENVGSIIGGGMVIGGSIGIVTLCRRLPNKDTKYSYA